MPKVKWSYTAGMLATACQHIWQRRSHSLGERLGCPCSMHTPRLHPVFCSMLWMVQATGSRFL